MQVLGGRRGNARVLACQVVQGGFKLQLHPQPHTGRGRQTGAGRVRHGGETQQRTGAKGRYHCWRPGLHRNAAAHPSEGCAALRTTSSFVRRHAGRPGPAPTRALPGCAHSLGDVAMWLAMARDASAGPRSDPAATTTHSAAGVLHAALCVRLWPGTSVKKRRRAEARLQKAMDVSSFADIPQHALLCRRFEAHAWTCLHLWGSGAGGRVYGRGDERWWGHMNGHAMPRHAIQTACRADRQAYYYWTPYLTLHSARPSRPQTRTHAHDDLPPTCSCTWPSCSARL